MGTFYLIICFPSPFCYLHQGFHFWLSGHHLSFMSLTSLYCFSTFLEQFLRPPFTTVIQISIVSFFFPVIKAIWILFYCYFFLHFYYFPFPKLFPHHSMSPHLSPTWTALPFLSAWLGKSSFQDWRYAECWCSHFKGKLAESSRPWEPARLQWESFIFSSLPSSLTFFTDGIYVKLHNSQWTDSRSLGVFNSTWGSQLMKIRALKH